MPATLTYGARTYSIGPVMQQQVTYSVLSTDTSMVLTMPSLHIAESVFVPGLVLTAAPIYSNNTVTLSFNVNTQITYGTIVVHGK